MFWIELILLSVSCFISIYAAVSDLKKGVISNRILAISAISALILDSIYYGIFAKDIFFDFIINIIILILTATILYGFHILAGGDLKLIVVLALLYPAHLYLSINSNIMTLFLIIFFAFIIGYVYMIFDGAYKVAIGEYRISVSNFVQSIKRFLLLYVISLLYIIPIQLLFSQVLYQYITLLPIVSTIAYMIVTWCVSTVRILQNKLIIIAFLLLDIILSVIHKTFPLSTDWRGYVAILFFVSLRIVLQNNTYLTVPAERIQKGTILSRESSLVCMQFGVKDLNLLVTEDLKSRLTERQAEQIRLWGKINKLSFSIVRKIPFACFVSMAFLIYAIIGVIVTWL